MVQQDYASQFKRKFTLEPAAAALVIIDLQYASGSRGHGLGARLAAEGREATGKWRFDRIEELVVPNLQRLLACFRERGLPVVYLTFGSATGDFQDVTPYLRGLVERTDNRAGSRTHEILDEVAPQDGDVVLNKTTASAFLSTDLHRVLQERGIRQLILTGVSTNSCVESTGRDGADLGYECLLVDDCCSSATEEFHLAAVANFERLFGRIAIVDEVLAELGCP